MQRFGICTLFLMLVIPGQLLAQIATDGSLGPPAQALTGPNFLIDPSLGAQAGNNLFHSFDLFNVNNGETATFTTSNLLENIIARVTGGSGSNIDGTIATTAPGASLWLINPAGFVLGADAVLDVQGSFCPTRTSYWW